jgi:hypothetical protein
LFARAGRPAAVIESGAEAEQKIDTYHNKKKMYYHFYDYSLAAACFCRCKIDEK